MSRVGNLSSRIFVGGLDPAVDEIDLEKAFKLFGEITNVMVLRDRENGRSRGFSFISFKDSQSSEEAISRMHGVEIRGRCVSVRHAEREKHLDDKPHQSNTRFTSTGNRPSSFHGQSYGGNFSQAGRNVRYASDRVYVTDEDNQDEIVSHSYPRHSRSPLRRAPVKYEQSPPRRVYSAKEYSPPRIGRDNFSPPKNRADFDDNYYRSGKPFQYESSMNEYSRYESRGSLSPARERDAYVNSRASDYSTMLMSGGKTSMRKRDQGGPRDDEYGRGVLRGSSPPRQEFNTRRDDYHTRPQYYDKSNQSPSRRGFAETEWQAPMRKQQSPDRDFRSYSPRLQGNYQSKARRRSPENIDSSALNWNKQTQRSSRGPERDDWSRRQPSGTQSLDERKGDWKKRTLERSPQEYGLRAKEFSKNYNSGDPQGSRRDEWRKSPVNRIRNKSPVPRKRADFDARATFERSSQSRGNGHEVAPSYTNIRDRPQSGSRENWSRPQPSRYQDSLDSRRGSANSAAPRRGSANSDAPRRGGRRQSGNEGRPQFRSMRDRSPITRSPASSRRY